MRINDVLECFNKTLDRLKEKRNICSEGHFVATSKWERNIGSIKTATTEISFVKNNIVTTITKESYTTNVPVGHEEEIMEETQRRALGKFISFWTENIESFIRDNYDIGTE